MADEPTPTVSRSHWVGYTLVIAVLVILALNGFLFIFWNHISDPRVFIAITLVSLFVLATTTTLAIIFLWGAGVLHFNDEFLHWLGGATIAEVSGILLIIINFYFNGQNPKPQTSAVPAAQVQTVPGQAQPAALPNAVPAAATAGK